MSVVSHRPDGPVSIVTLDRPERLNAISSALLVDLHAALLEAQAEPSTRVIVFAGAGRAFCAGIDLKDFDAQAATPQTMAEHTQSIQQITRDLMFGDKFVIAAAQGYAVGGGFEWLLNCDLVVAADDLVAFFPEMALGHFVTGGVTALLPQRLGHLRAVELLVLGERHDAQALHRLGLVNRVVPAAELMPKVLALANTVASRSAVAMARLKQALTAPLGDRLNAALDTETRAAAECFGDADTGARVRAFAKSRL